MILKNHTLDDVTGQIFVAYSGGCDSHVLLHLLNDQLDQDLQAVHINHGLSSNADRWQGHVESVCDELSIPVRSFKVEVSREGSLEANARSARYQVFESLLGPDDVVVMAHHLDDQVETVLLNLMSGRAPYGLQGMPVSRSLGAGRLERPLIHVSREQIVTYAREHHLTWIEDESNLDTQHDRNYLRQTVLPVLESRWPNVRTSLLNQLSRTTSLVKQEEARAQQTLQTLRISWDCISSEGFDRLPNQDACQLLRVWLLEAGLVKLPGVETLNLAVTVLSGEGVPKFELDDWCLQRCQSRIVLVCVPMLERGGISTNIAKGTGITLAPGQFQLRSRNEGDKLLLNGHHQSLKNIFQSSGIPPLVRDHLPIVCDGDEPIAVAGIPNWHIEMVVGDVARAAADVEGCEVAWSNQSN